MSHLREINTVLHVYACVCMLDLMGKRKVLCRSLFGCETESIHLLAKQGGRELKKKKKHTFISMQDFEDSYLTIKNDLK